MRVSKLNYLLAAIGILAFALLTIRPVYAATGLLYDAVISTTTEGSGMVLQIVTTVWASSENYRVNLKESMGSTEILVGYFLSRDGGRTVAFVNPTTKQYSKLGTPTVDQKRLPAEATPSASSAQANVVKLSDEAGGSLLGFPVRHYRLRGEFSAADKRHPQQRSASEMTDDVWVAIAGLDTEGLVIPSVQSPLLTFVSQLEPVNLTDGTQIRGFQLKRNSTFLFPTTDGKSHAMQITMEVKGVQRLDIPDSQFEMPEAFKEVPWKQIIFPQPGQP